MSALALAVGLATTVGLALGVLGGGGSILTLPILLYVLGLEEQEAIATSLVVVGVTSLFAMVPHARARHVDLRVGLAFAGVGALGAFAGGWVAGALPPKLLLGGFVAVMVVAGIGMIRRRPTNAALPTLSWPRTLLAGLGSGAMTGLVGAGGGFVVVPALVLFGGLEVRTAVGTSLLVITLNTAAGLLGHLTHVHVQPGPTAAITAAAVVGSLVGATLSQRVPQDQLRKGFGLFVLAMAALMVFLAW